MHMSKAHIIFKELMPNVFSYIAINFVMAMRNAIMASVGIMLVGLAAYDPTQLGRYHQRRSDKGTHEREKYLYTPVSARLYHRLSDCYFGAGERARRDVESSFEGTLRWDMQTQTDNIAVFRNVSIDYPLKKYTIRAVTDVNFELKRGKITALVGESGFGGKPRSLPRSSAAFLNRGASRREKFSSAEKTKRAK